MRKQRDREKLEEYREKRDNQFQYKSIPDIEKMLTEDGSFCYSSEEEGPPTKMKLEVSYPHFCPRLTRSIRSGRWMSKASRETRQQRSSRRHWQSSWAERRIGRRWTTQLSRSA